ncbi:hypothetical protein HUK80_16305 [Flavobacterium sp. MAH-1]|uniref:HEPN AbiJ-N-terminal domain-containing protein n=1 Tax=Flavobacterium agri TaxID=2743471 RepID=A0A7Y8Y5V3_9FLAO|nr:hypothetical protein [Flavobacterium agri]NUY82469.1 hypothetical protein [Flavobacterium agri]NYA72493.1 hypothetical protein [Flavobacterium agri]
MRFSQRIGKTKVKDVLQIESIDLDLKNRLWNIILENFFENLSDYSSRYEESHRGEYCKIIWKEFFHNTIDTISQYDDGRVFWSGFLRFFREWYFRAEWYEIFDFIEYVAFLDQNYIHNNFTALCNTALEIEVSGYRIINSKITEITSATEIGEIENAINDVSANSVKLHLTTALNLLADRKKPDYRNSIKESISAVESYCKIITQDANATLGKALIEIEKKIELHGALKTAFSALYGYTSDASGIRHALLEDHKQITFEDAKFILVCCSAFINYLTSKNR